ncbi:GMC oxidoreductase [Rhodococcus sp. F64268]|uniref:GMC oxidoreductase n=1 Tax=Rhodococcus sp. F64268 TaxID=2926402 RepID=UPI001FF5DC2F|nr:GMC oxidoreductase [Rhodococcus sp. F64268]MCK0089392.1 GMC oxidoreductase [Rhodococcus sp. F64268]
MSTTLSRRAFLGGAAVAAVGLTVTAVPRARAEVTEERHRAVVIGSGFGGAITAMHLGRAGVQTVVMERGIRWPTGPNAETFPRMLHPDRRMSWLSPIPVMPGTPPVPTESFTGLIERVPGDGMDILCGAGVGGSSLAYHGMTLQPDGERFAQSVSSSIDYDRLDSEYYRRVERMLRMATIPDDVLGHERYRSSRVFLDRAEAEGYETFRVPMSIDWDFARRELTGELNPSYTTGDVIYGVNNGGKFSVDVTYLAEAEATGHVDVVILHRVNDIERGPDGTWITHVDRIHTDGTVLERKRIVSDALFLGAGSAGTTRLLMKAHGKGLITDLPDAVGTGWGNNGDRVFSVTSPLASPGAFQGGPACVGMRDHSDPAGALMIVTGPVPFPADIGTTSVIGLGVVKGLGRWNYDAGRDDAVLNWDEAYDRALTRAIESRIRRIVGPTAIMIDVNAVDINTFHPLGGAPLDTVCDDAGRVLGQRGLYVVDGAKIPGSTGACNPSMTIAALAEYGADDIVARDLGSVF